MIPFIFRLRKSIRFEKGEASSIVISDIPLNIIRVSPRAEAVLKLCDGTNTLKQIVDKTGISDEAQVFKMCEYFNRKGILEIEPAEDSSYVPSVTVIIPTRDRKGELVECLESVLAQDYPKDKLEVIVIDDGSEDGTDDVVRAFPCKLLSHKNSRGQSYCRNLGAKEAHGEILAFVDSDCVAGRQWLRELVHYFQWDRIGAVGGFVDGYFQESPLDRYEKTCSPLNMGAHIIHGSNDGSAFYVPTCNLLVRKTAYAAIGGITESLHVGEDVDFCWRLRNAGYDMFYVPRGAVRHKHRNSLGRMLKRRADYGTSEAQLYGLHQERTKVFQVPPLAAIAFISLCAALLTSSMLLVIPAGICLVLEAGLKLRRISRMNLSIPLWKVLFSTVRSHVSFFYFISFHLVRYYILLFLVLGFVSPLPGCWVSSWSLWQRRWTMLSRRQNWPFRPLSSTMFWTTFLTNQGFLPDASGQGTFGPIYQGFSEDHLPSRETATVSAKASPRGSTND